MSNHFLVTNCLVAFIVLLVGVNTEENHGRFSHSLDEELINFLRERKNLPAECSPESSNLKLPHENSCSYYYHCRGNLKLLQKCSQNLHFNVIKQICDWPERSGCISSMSSIDQGSVSDVEFATCPPDNSGGVLYLPHETNCSLFYKCDNGKKEKQGCPPKLHFNVALQICDKPSNAGCAHATTLPPVDEEGSGQVPTTCPPDNTGGVVHLPHETNCSLFYKCDYGKKVKQECPVGLHFNVLHQICDWPSDAGCDHTATLPPVDEDVGSGEVPTKCPPDNSGGVVHLAHETNCSLFYKCDYGKKVKQECPAGLHFNVLHQICDWPSTAGCAHAVTLPPVDDKTGPGEIPTTCPPDNGGGVVHLPHETNCSLFYKCNNGKKVVMMCPDNLHYNPIYQVCDWPENVICPGTPVPTESSTTVTGETKITTKSTDPPTKVTIGSTALPTTITTNVTPSPTDASTVNTDPTVTCPNGLKIAHETSCSYYYYCVDGRKILMKCYPGLHFNPAMQVCYYPNDLICKDKDVVPTSAPTTVLPTTSQPTTVRPTTTQQPTTVQPATTQQPTTVQPTTTQQPTTALPATTQQPTTVQPTTTQQPSTARPTTTQQPTTVRPTTTQQPTTARPTTTQQPTTVPTTTQTSNPNSKECPKNKPISYLTHEKDCNSYYRCEYGVKILKKCPNGLYFNIVLETCDFKENVICDAVPDVTTLHPTSVTESPSTTTKQPTVSITTQQPVVSTTAQQPIVSTTTEQPTVPTTTEQHVVSTTTQQPVVPTTIVSNECRFAGNHSKIPHETNCKLFYKCLDGEKILQNCPSDLYFHPQLEACYFKEDTPCFSG